MKKITLSLLIALGAMTAEAQIVSSTSSIVTTEVQNIRYVKVGFDIGSSSSSDINVKSGVSILFGAEYSFKNPNLYYGGEVGFAPNGIEKYSTYNYSSSSSSSSTKTVLNQTSKYKGYKFLLNPKIGYKYHVTDDITLDSNVGIFASFGFRGATYYYETVEYTYNGTSTEYYSDSFKSDEGGGATNVGISLGFGAWYKNKYNASLEYQRGLYYNYNYFRIALAMRVNKPKTKSKSVVNR